MKVIYSGILSNRGERKFELGNMQLLRDFQFCPQSTIENNNFTQVRITEAPDQVTVTIPAFVAAIHIRLVEKSTHFRITLIRAEIDFAAKSFTFQSANFWEVLIEMTEIPTLDLVFPMVAVPRTHLFFALAMEYLQVLENGFKYNLYDLTQNPAKILVVSCSGH